MSATGHLTKSYNWHMREDARYQEQINPDSETWHLVATAKVQQLVSILEREHPGEGLKYYHAWCDEALTERYTWKELSDTVQIEINKYDDLTGINRHWSDDPKYWAGGA